MIQTNQQLFALAVQRLRPVIGDDAIRDARHLLAAALGCAMNRLTLAMPEKATVKQAERFFEMIAARMQRQPVAQITGKRRFYNLDFIVTPAVLDPRPETETLVHAALQGGPFRRVLDLGTGSGCILLSLLNENVEARGLGIDNSSKALRVAKLNARNLKLSDRVVFRESNWFASVTGKFDLIVANPPYISEVEMGDLAPEVRSWEPKAALSPGGDGLQAYRKIAENLDQFMEPGGRAFLEFGRWQSQSVLQIFTDAGFPECDMLPDMDGQPRVIFIRNF